MNNVWQFLGYLVGMGCLAGVALLFWKALNPKPPFRK
jgi:hypothetical protein